MTHNWKFSYAGYDLPTPDENGIDVELQPIDTTERNAAGDLMMEKVALKRRVSVTWSRLTGKDTNTIMSTLANNRTGKLEYFDISVGDFKTLDTYYGSGAKVSFTRYDNDMAKQKYNSLTVNFVEM